eukprot:1158557-Pelagomonas_calceolata.AAC.1
MDTLLHVRQGYTALAAGSLLRWPELRNGSLTELDHTVKATPWPGRNQAHTKAATNNNKTTNKSTNNNKKKPDHDWGHTLARAQPSPQQGCHQEQQGYDQDCHQQQGHNQSRNQSSRSFRSLATNEAIPQPEPAEHATDNQTSGFPRHCHTGFPRHCHTGFADKAASLAPNLAFNAYGAFLAPCGADLLVPCILLRHLK